jgi:hypothetical protein
MALHQGFDLCGSPTDPRITRIGTQGDLSKIEHYRITALRRRLIIGATWSLGRR